ncbi:MAG: UDP-4-amino-4,6-dideoxy-N-acetyl-beta-L-altrosamine N-acetyltransferase [Candidatus Zixiibacteriota bacterium]
MNLRFRNINPDDLPMILEWRTMPEVADYMYTDFEPKIEIQQKWYEAINKDNTRRDWLINVDGEDVGLLSIVRIDDLNQRCEWAYYLASPTVRGKGIGKSVELNVLEYVFENLKLNKLCCEVLGNNELVVRIHEKYGSKIEGNRRRHIFKRGEFHDIVEMGILREDWEKKIRGKHEYVKAKFD